MQKTAEPIEKRFWTKTRVGQLTMEVQILQREGEISGLSLSAPFKSTGNLRCSRRAFAAKGQVGQHPLTGDRATNFRLQANQ